MHDVLRFWLDRGVDGFRIDVVHLIGKDPALPDQPASTAPLDRVGIHDDPRTHPLLRGIRAVLDSYPGERVMRRRGLPARTAGRSRAYYGERRRAAPRVQLPAAARRRGRRRPGATLIETVERELARARGRRGCSPTTTTRGTAPATAAPRAGPGGGRAAADAARHAVPLRRRGARARGRRRARGAARRPRRPRRLPRADPVDPAGPRLAGEDPWLPLPPEAGRRSVEAERDDPGSMFHLYRAVLIERRSSPALSQGKSGWGHPLKGFWRMSDAPAMTCARCW